MTALETLPRPKKLQVIGFLALTLASSLPVASCNAERGTSSESTEVTAEAPKGPHGGRLLGTGEFQAEVTIYETGVPPEFRVYFFERGNALAPTEAWVAIELLRHGGRLDKVQFKPEQDFLQGDKEIVEPHSFDVTVQAKRGAQIYNWSYSQREGRVELSDDAVRTSAISIETATAVTMRSVSALPGEVTYNGDKLAHIVPRLSGVLRDIKKSQGDEVRRGEVIAILDSRELAVAKRDYLEADQELQFATRAFEREETLWKKNIASEASYLAQERAYQDARLRRQSAQQELRALGIGDATLTKLDDPAANLTLYPLTAPFDGVLIEKKVATGQAVQGHDDLFTVADLSSVWVEVTVYAKDLPNVKLGQEVTIESDNLNAKATGRITYIGSLLGGQTRSAKARVVLPDPERRWKAGLFVAAVVVQDEVKVPVAVKREGLQKFRDWDVVFVRAGNEFEARPLELGREDGEWVEVVSGLASGERYAGANSFVLKADVGKSGASHDH